MFYSRGLFLTHRIQLGLNLSFEKQNSVLKGDSQECETHPFIVHYANLFGKLYHQCDTQHAHTPFLETIYLHETMDALERMQENDDPQAFAHANFLVAEMYFYTQFIDAGLHYLAITAEVVVRHNIRFAPNCRVENVDPSDFIRYSEDVHERAAFLAQLIYVETCLALLLNHRPVHFSGLETQLRDFEVSLGVSPCLILFTIFSSRRAQICLAYAQ